MPTNLVFARCTRAKVFSCSFLTRSPAGATLCPSLFLLNFLHFFFSLLPCPITRMRLHGAVSQSVLRPASAVAAFARCFRVLEPENSLLLSSAKFGRLLTWNFFGYPLKKFFANFNFGVRSCIINIKVVDNTIKKSGVVEKSTTSLCFLWVKWFWFSSRKVDFWGEIVFVGRLRNGYLRCLSSYWIR